MAEIVFTPSGRDALQAGTFIDDEGGRFVALTFKEPGRDPLIVTLTPELFRDYVGHLNRVVDAAQEESTWR